MTVVIILTGMAGDADAQSPFFSSAPPIAIEVGASFLLADLNHDGRPDILTRHATNRTVSVRLGDGKGQFTLATGSPLRLDCEPGAMAHADVNNDGDTDLAVAAREGDKETVRIFLGSREGVFRSAPGSPFTVSSAATSYKPALRFVDLDKDGKLDLVTANGRRNAVEVCLGDGRGGFSRPSVVPLEPGRWTYTFELGDLDGDTHADLVIASGLIVSDPASGHLVVRRGDGKGGFAEPTGAALDVPPDPNVAALEDLNGDHQLDTVLTHGRTNVLTVLLNDGRGGFKPGSPVRIGMTAFTVAVADINRDRRADLVATTVDSRLAPHEARFEILLGDGFGGFKPTAGSVFAAEPGSYKFALGDINGDNKLDIVASSFGGRTLTLLYGR